MLTVFELVHPNRKKTNMFCRQIVSYSMKNFRFYATEASPLAVLRKKTGYSFVNCKKALEMTNNDVSKVRKHSQSLLENRVII